MSGDLTQTERLETHLALAEKTVLAAEEALTEERELRKALEQKNEKNGETIKELESFRNEMEKELANLRDQLKEANGEKSVLSKNFEVFTETAKSEIRNLKLKLDDFAREAHQVELQRLNDKLVVDNQLAQLKAHNQILEQQVVLYKEALEALGEGAEKHVAKTIQLDTSLSKLHAERSEEKTALAALLNDNKLKLRNVLDQLECEKLKTLDLTMKLQEFEKENVFLKATTHTIL
jgi:hypothetical protein